MNRSKRLGERLLDAGVLTPQELELALEAQEATGERLGEVLLRLRHASEHDVMRALCENAGIPFLSAAELRPEAAAVAAVPEHVARERTALPLALEGNRLTIVVPNPFDVSAVIGLEQATGRLVSVECAPRELIEEGIEEFYGNGDGGIPGLVLEADDAPPTRRPPPGRPPVEEDTGTAAELADDIVREAVAQGATDIHIEPQRDAVGVRFRVDGVLQQHGTYPKSVQGALVSRIKVVAGLDIAENRLPQDGRLRRVVDDREIDLRISTFPTLHGEDLVLRVLDRRRVPLDLEGLGMAGEDVVLFRDVLRKPHGLVLITGPTGSGKTTTLYAALNEMNRGDRSIVTLEDPVEYELPGVRQAQINVRAGLTFASGLRSLLRHDPDVILVGEMRDPETVQIGLSAALTGHMVLTTLHTNSAASAVPRLLDMGAEPFVLASSVQLIIAQRLVRVLCVECKHVASVPAPVRKRFGLEGVTLFTGRGCAACNGTGYRGRVGIFELLPSSNELTECIYSGVSAEELQRRCGRRTLFEDGLAKVRAGITSLDELVRKASLF